MLTGYNTDTKYNGVVYHVQTEDGGQDNPTVVTLVYRGGRILASKKTNYAQLVGSEDLITTVRNLMEKQHRTMLAAVNGGVFSEERWPPPGGVPESARPDSVPAPPLGAEAPPATHDEKSLDQVILEYLATELGKK